MSHFECGLTAAMLLTFVCPPASAQSSPSSRDPTDPRAPVPAVSYASPLRASRASGDVDVGSWRNANKAVGRIGGWRTYGREAIDGTKSDGQAKAVAPSERPAASAPPPGGYKQ
jgi:hypothetical protein